MALRISFLVLSLLYASSSQQDDVVATLAGLELQWNSAHVRGDAAALEQLFDDDLVVMAPGMRALTKADALGVFASGRMKFGRYETSEIATRLYGTTAIVTGRLRRSRTMGDRTVDDDWRFTKVYVKRGERWKVVSFHASNVNP